MAIYILSVFLSAFLLFQIQPMVGKFILPWFGGTSAVWSTIMVFFQTMLTGGYAYAYWLIGLRSKKKQRWTHLLLISASLVVLAIMSLDGSPPITPNEIFKPINPQQPVWEILKILALLVGLPALVLSANSTLVQTWFASSNPERSPYWLYALSNTGSLLALATYPLVVEPRLTLDTQGWVWAGGFLVFSITTGYLILRRGPRPQDSRLHSPSQSAICGQEDPPRQHQIMWISLSAAASILLLSTTSQLTQEVAPIPLLWVLPLTIYLLTFILSFSGERFYNRPLFTLMLTISSIGIVYNLANPRLNFKFQIVIYSIFLFSACMVAHAELYRLRPDPSRLSRFYLFISAGGALGGIFVNLISPQIFNGYWEFHIGWILIFILLVSLTFFSPTRELKAPWRKGHDLATILLTVVFMLLSLDAVTSFSSKSLFQERNFYGVSKVIHNQYKAAYQYVNGSTIHGFQIISEDQRSIPTSYFWRDSGIAIVIRNHPRYQDEMNVGVMGLGIGTLAAHGFPGDSYRFYEIDPIVIELAQGKEGYFSFLEDSAAEITIAPGDARLSLEEELNQGNNQDFDLLVMDAFSSDSVPVHLITREAIEIYLEHMSPTGVIAINISNSYIDLTPVIFNIGKKLGLATILIAPPVQEYHPIGIRSFWMFLAKDPSIFDSPEIKANADLLTDFQTEIPLWTDDYSNLFSILRD